MSFVARNLIKIFFQAGLLCYLNTPSKTKICQTCLSWSSYLENCWSWCLHFSNFSIVEQNIGEDSLVSILRTVVAVKELLDMYASHEDTRDHLDSRVIVAADQLLYVMYFQLKVWVGRTLFKCTWRENRRRGNGEMNETQAQT